MQQVVSNKCHKYQIDLNCLRNNILLVNLSLSKSKIHSFRRMNME